MATGASQIFVEQVREAAAILGLGGGAAARAYLLARMDDQNSDLAQNDHVEFDEVLEVDASGDIALSSGGGDQTDGLISLAAGKVYSLEAGIQADMSTAAGVVRFRFRNNTAAAEIGSQGEAFMVTGTVNWARTAIAQAIIAPAVLTQLELRITGVFQLAGFRGGGAVGNSYLKVLEIG